MPTYQYRCTECAHDLEAVQKFTDPALTECPSCSGSLRKVYNAVGVVFKGSGFYRTDSRKAPSEGGSSESKGAPADAKNANGNSNGSGGNGKENGSAGGAKAPAKESAPSSSSASSSSSSSTSSTTTKAATS